ncbi:hypothetical protein BZA70DRAFT_272723 [Myxozyma melibiosi]|uniref:Flavin-binding monooxygenase n=1 Tax=Myxozyma melibiosi TaxID=54550 RepID=A0ABR1FDT2_9ASCO
MTADSTKNGDTGKPENWVPVFEEILYTPQRKLRIVCAGAGFSGLMLAHKIQHELKAEEFMDLQIYEKNAGIGGTWYETRYMGAALDVPAHMYTFQFEPYTEWSHFHVYRDEVLEYMNRTTKKYNLDKHVAFESRITSAHWSDEKAKWLIEVEKADRTIIKDEADVFVDCSGLLNKWRWPNVPGLQDFKGHIVHSANWDEDHDYEGERVAIIGNGASGIQILPQMVKKAKYTANIIRSPTWIMSNFGAEFTPDGKNFKFTEEQKTEFRTKPETHRKFRHEMETATNKRFPSLHKDSKEQKAFVEYVTKNMHRRLGGDPELIEKLVPKYDIGCRKATPGDNYLECFANKLADPIIGGIKRFTETGIELDDGRRYEFDAIVCATGFDTSFMPKWDLSGRNGARLEKLWAEAPYAYFSTVLPEMPNYFMVNGPNSASGHALILTGMATVVEYISKWLNKMAEEGIKSIVVKKKSIDDYNVYTQEFLKRMVWSGGCASWYKAGKDPNRVTALYGGSMLHFKKIMSAIRAEDFEIEYLSSNSFMFMGNGYCDIEVNGGDLAYYL